MLGEESRIEAVMNLPSAVPMVETRELYVFFGRNTTILSIPSLEFYVCYECQRRRNYGPTFRLGLPRTTNGSSKPFDNCLRIDSGYRNGRRIVISTSDSISIRLEISRTALLLKNFERGFSLTRTHLLSKIDLIGQKSNLHDRYVKFRKKISTLVEYY